MATRKAVKNEQSTPDNAAQGVLPDSPLPPDRAHQANDAPPSESMIACSITVHYGGMSIALEKRVYSEAKSLAEQSAEYDKLQLQLEHHHAEYRTNHLPKFKPTGKGVT